MAYNYFNRNFDTSWGEEHPQQVGRQTMPQSSVSQRLMKYQQQSHSGQSPQAQAQPSQPGVYSPQHYPMNQGQNAQMQNMLNYQHIQGQMCTPPPVYEKNNQFIDRVFTTSPTLSVGSSHLAIISHIEDGPYSFSIQLKSAIEEVLPHIKNVLNQYTPSLISSPILPGTTVMGRSKTDLEYRRCFVMNVYTNSCVVYYIDYGSLEELPYSEIYQLPTAAIDIAPPQALRFCLAELEDVNITTLSKEFFSKLLNRQVHIRVTEREGPLYHYCDMHFEGQNIKELLVNLNSPLEYTNQFPPRGREMSVVVSYVDSPTQFFVQYSSEISVLGQILESMRLYGPTQPRLQNLDSINIGSPVACLFSQDNLWYRGLVIGVDSDKINVFFVDYGNRDNVSVNQLCNISRSLVKKWRSQAVECCLSGFENATPDPILASLMEELTLGLRFTLKLRSMLNGNRLSVELINDKGQNINKMIEEKAEARELSKLSISIPKTNLNKKEYQSPQAVNLGDSGGNRWNAGRKSSGDRDSENNRFIRPPHNQHDDRCDDYKQNRGRAEGGDPKSKSSVLTKMNDGNDLRETESSENSWKADKKTDNFYERKYTDRTDKDSNKFDRKNRYEDHENNRFGERGNVKEGRGDKFGERREKFVDRDNNKYKGDKDRQNRFSDRSFQEDRPNRFHDRNFQEDRSNRFNDRNFQEDRPNRHDRSSQEDRLNRYSDRSFQDDRPDRRDRYNNKARSDYSENDKFSDKTDRSNRYDKNDRTNKDGDNRFNKDGSNRFNRDGNNRFNRDGNNSFNRDGNNSFNREQGGERKRFDKNDRPPRFNRDFGSNKSFGEETNKNFEPVVNVKELQNESWDEEASVVPASQIVSSFSQLDISEGQEITAHFCFMNAPNDIYVQLTESETTLVKIREAISAHSNSSSGSIACSDMVRAMPVLARYPDDGLLYRAIVREIFKPSDKVSVMYVDYGNLATVSSFDIFTITKELASTPIQALRVVLNNLKPPENGWPSELTRYQTMYENFGPITVNITKVKIVDGEMVANAIASESLVSQFERGSEEASPVKQTSVPNENVQSVEKPENEHVPGLIFLDVWAEKLDLLLDQFLYSKKIAKLKENLYLVNIEAANVEVMAEVLPGKKLTQEIPERHIINVMKIGEDRLFVDFYNLDGDDCGEGSDISLTICPVCPFPVVNRVDYFYLCHYEGAILYLQKSKDAGKNSEMLEELFEFYENTPVQKVDWEPGMLCCAKSADGNWYRAKVINGPDMMIKYIDYGNTEKVGLDQLRKLDKKFTNDPEFCFPVVLPVELKQNEVPFEDLVGMFEFKVSLLKNNLGKWVGDLVFMSTGERLSDKLVNNGQATLKPNSLFAPENLPVDWDFRIGMKFSVVVSHVDSPTMFWVQLTRDIDRIEAVQEALTDALKPGKEGQVFAALYQQDSIWYRAIKTKNDEVRFIDYGNTDIALERRPIPEEFMKPESGYALQFFLCVKPIGNDWSEDANKIFEDFIERELEAKIISLSYKIVVDLISEGTSLSDLLIKGNHGTFTDHTPQFVSEAMPETTNKSNVTQNKHFSRPLPQNPNTDLPGVQKVYICYLNSVNNFSIQYESQSKELENLLGSLLEANTFEKLTDFEVGDLVAAQFPEDDLWYRARVLSKDPLKAVFVDYGNTSYISEVRKLPEEMFGLPQYAIPCSLNIDETEDLNEKFYQLHKSGDAPFEVVYTTRGDPNIVTLKHFEGDDILNDILPSNDSIIKKSQENLSPPKETVKLDDEKEESTKIQSKLSPEKPEHLECFKSCLIAYFKSPSLFYTQTPEHSTQVEELNEKLADADNFPDVSSPLKLGDKVLARFPEDNAWYRAVVIELPNTVLFIDYGNESKVEEFKKLPETMDSPQLVYKCSLVKPEGVETWSESAVDKFKSMINLEIYFDVYVFQDGDEKMVDLYVSGKSLSDELGKLCEQNQQELKQCILTHFNTLNDFYIQNINSPELMIIESAMQNQLTPIDLKDVKIGDFIVCPFEEPESFYRAKVLDVNPLKVYSVDCGNIDIVEKAFKMPDDIKNLPPLALHCSLNFNDKTLEGELGERLVQLAGDLEKIEYTIIGESHDKKIIQLYTGGEKFINEDKINDQNKQTDIKNVRVVEGFVSYFETLNKFFIQENTDEIDRMSDILNSRELEEQNVIKIGDLIAANFPEDGVWYRSRVIEVEPIQKVLFVDYGNTLDVTDVRQLPKELVNVPPQCVEVSLNRKNGDTVWPEDANQAARDMFDKYKVKITQWTRDGCKEHNIKFEGNDPTNYFENSILPEGSFETSKDDVFRPSKE
ncbi:maternal protein tudor isoform X2 [Cimex lectularius]|uniref:Tudor domain-containing protein n=1 Tax=Cimex lectularius TaxID=79782 RepID=A0A8I6RCZ3_CIMLE|nr:maternal protein tudor isoform X2 [Cimex lectularius]